MVAQVEFVQDKDNHTTSFLVDGVEMGMWINKQPPTWAKKLIEIIEQRSALGK